MDIHHAIRTRRTIHSFNADKVPEEFLERAIEAANYAPCHRLTFPWRFTKVNRYKREVLVELALDIKFAGRNIDQASKSLIIKKMLNPSHMLVASQVLTNDLKQKMEDYAACACAIQNLSLSLVSDGVGSKWSTGKMISDKRTYEVVGINQIAEEIIGFIWIGYGEIPPKIDRPRISSIFRS